MDTYAFILGRQPELAVAEILACLKRPGTPESRYAFPAVNEEFTLLELTSNLDVGGLFERLGGSVKLVQISDRVELAANTPDPAQQVADYLISQASASGRLMFGLSFYGSPRLEDFARLPQAVKRLLSERGRESRYIEPQPKPRKALSSAQVQKTGLLAQGIEVVLLCSGAALWIGKTLRVQPFEEFARRDFGKPERRIDPGLLPPKLARMMLNLARVADQGAILDPFCGSGVVLVEGAMLGYSMTGLDHCAEAVEASRANLEWLRKSSPGLPEWRLEAGDAQRIVSRFGPFAFDAAVGEGDLGPSFSRFPAEKELRGLVKRYKSFYTTVLAELRSGVRPGGSVVLAVPRWFLEGGRSVGLGLNKPLRLMGYRRQALFEGCLDRVPPAWRERPLVYHRRGQKTAREILCLKT